MRGNPTDNQPANEKVGGKGRKLRFLIPFVLILTVAAVACGGSGGGSTGSGDPAPDFSITMFQGQDVVGGQEVNLHDLVGQKPIVLNFWAGLCPPCRAEMPDLQAFSEKFEDKVLVLGIDLGQSFGLGSQQDAQDLLDELEVTYPAGFPNDANVFQDYEIFGLPATVFIDAQGEIFTKWTGALNGDVLEEKTLEMLAQ